MISLILNKISQFRTFPISLKALLSKSLILKPPLFGPHGDIIAPGYFYFLGSEAVPSRNAANFDGVIEVDDLLRLLWSSIGTLYFILNFFVVYYVLMCLDKLQFRDLRFFIVNYLVFWRVSKKVSILSRGNHSPILNFMGQWDKSGFVSLEIKMDINESLRITIR